MHENSGGDGAGTGMLRAAFAFLIGIVLIVVSHQVPLKWVEDLLHEIGSALLVAVIIWLTFEYFSHSDREASWRRRIEQITGEVFYGVLRRNLPRELLAEANLLILEQNFIRKGLSLEYILEDSEITYATGGPGKKFLKLTAILRYTVLNIADTAKMFPIAVAVPNPTTPELKPFADVTSLSYEHNGQRHNLNLANPRRLFRAGMEASKASHVRCDCAEIELGPGGQPEVEIRYVMPKEEEDAENFETLFPSDSLRLMVIDKGTQRRQVGATAHHPGNLQDLTA